MDELASTGSLFDEQLALYEQLLAEEGIEAPESESIPLRPAGEATPLSFAQARLWFLDRWQPGSFNYNVYTAYRLAIAISPCLLAASLREVVGRHEALRTTFAEIDGRPVQLVNPDLAAPLAVVELSSLPEARREAEAQRLATVEARCPFDLGRGPLLRVTLVQLGGSLSILFAVMHHIVSDGWSMGVLMREIVTLYRAFAAGWPSPLPPQPIQFGDFAAWQRRRLSGEHLEAEIAWWRERLAGAPTVLELPTDRPRPPLQSFRGAVRYITLPVDLVSPLRALGREEGATLFMVLLAGLAILLEHATGQDDLLVGSPIANRNRPELETVIGFFVNTLVLRVDLAGRPSFRELARRQREATYSAYDHQDIPFEKLVEELKPERDLSRSPLAQVLFTLQNLSALSRGGGGGDDADAIALLPISNGTAKFDLLIALSEVEGEAVGAIEYSVDLFDAATIDRFATNWQILLEGLIREPDRPAAEIPCLTEAESRALASWGAPRFRAPAFCLHDGFAEQAAKRPDAVAISLGAEILTYGELAARSSALALYLTSLGVEPGDLVGLCFERSIEMVVAILGALKAGAAYVPLDPHYPQERRELLVQDSGVRVVLAHAGLAESLPSRGARMVTLDEVRSGSQRRASMPLAQVSPEFPAYVIYTSGSTGKPKGVTVTHANVARLFAATDEWFGFGERDVWTLFHSYAFDFSVWELWGALLYGGRLVIVPYWTSRTAEEFHDLVANEGVTILNQTPSAFRQFVRVDEERPCALLALRSVVFGGEALDLASLGHWFDRRRASSPRLINMYGITETTVHVTYRELAPADVHPWVGTPIGVGIGDLTVRVLDRRGENTGIGIPGELSIGGAGVARGYLGRPELTAEKFVPDPWGEAGSRRYRSGDLGRFRGDGEIEYLGRIDHQVKVRGFRIELGEIESALASHPGVREAVVVLRGETLVGYWVGRQGEDPPGRALREFLLDRLPEHMVPGRLMELPELPLTVHGKIDRRALPAPEGRDAGVGYEAPRTAVEEVLAGVWSRVLEVEVVGVGDNFFALGGDSIRSLQVLSLARERGLSLSVQDIFRHQTIAELAVQAVGTDEVAAESDGGPFSLVSDEDRRLLSVRIADAEDAYPLARLQAGMLLHMALSPDEPPYHNVDSWRLRARLQPWALRRAAREVAARHPAMRTSFHLEGFSEPLQVVHREAALPIWIADLGGLPPAFREGEIARYSRGEKGHLFELGQSPQLRFVIHRIDGDLFQMTMTENHAIFDGWSLHATLREMFGRAFDLQRGDETPLPPPPRLTYREFVRLEREIVASKVAERFWEDQLSGASVLLLPRLRTAQEEGGPRVHAQVFPAPPDLSESLERLALEVAVPIKSVMLAAHLRALSVLTGATDVITGTVFNGRPEAPDGAEVRGLFLNTLPLRVQLGGGTFRQLIRTAFEAERELLPTRRLPLAELQRRQGGGALFEVLFNYIHFHVVESLLRSGEIEVLGFEGREGTNYPLHVVCTPGHLDRGLKVTLEYDAEIFGRQQIEAFGGTYLRVLQAMADAPDARYDETSLLSEEERRQLLVHLNATERAWSREAKGTVPAAIAERSQRASGRVAVVCGGEELTYGQLVQRADRLAWLLRQLGAGREVLVGIALERSLALAVGTLGVLATGAAYVPLDPSYPADRLSFMAEDSGVAVLVTDEAIVDWPGFAGEVVRLTTDGVLVTSAACEGDLSLASSALPDNLAYVIYTSGSTGRPKGVQVSHAALWNFLQSMLERPGFVEDDVLVAVTSLSFDIAGLELYGPLLAGARVVVATREETTDGKRLAALIEASGATVMQATPAGWRLLVESGWLGSPRLKALCGGEALAPALAATLLDRVGELWNLYGPTETTIWSTIEQISKAGDFTIGLPIANTRVFVADAFGRLAPVGVPGELWIGGTGLARGYKGRPDLTAERFIPDGLSPSPSEVGPGSDGGRLYRTGDLARVLPDGRIECLGRLDSQVKVRGYRIELGEIEAVLGAHPGVAAAAVIAWDLASGDRQLAAYVVPNGVEVPGHLELGSFLRERLPDYMVPVVFVALERLPLTPNGKVDRKALPRPAARVTADFVAPRTPTEEVLAGLWADVLKIDGVGAHDRFFDLGGHSLLATRLASRVRESFGVELPLRVLFDSPTLEGFAAAIDTVLGNPIAALAPPLVRVSRNGDPPLSFAQERLWFLDRLQPGSPAYNVPAAVRLTGDLGVKALAAALDEVVRRHESLRTTFRIDLGRPVQVIAPETQFALRRIDLAGLDLVRTEGHLSDLAAREALQPFDLATGPLVRATLVSLERGEHALLLTLHHIVSDAWSMGILVAEVARLYASFARGLPFELPALPVQYADYAVWQREWLRGDPLAEQLAYWRRILEDATVLVLPADRPRAPLQSYRGASRPLGIGRPLAEPLRALGRQRGSTLFMTLFAAFQALLHRLTGQDDLVVGSTIAGRTHRELEPLVGFFVNALALRTDLAGDPPFDALVASVRETALGAFAHQDLPFEKLVAEIQPERDLSRSPIFQVLFQLQNAPAAALPNAGIATGASGVEIRPMGQESQSAKFDLVVTAMDRGGVLSGDWKFNTDLFEPATIERMAARFERLLTAIVAEPERRLSELPLLGEEEREQLLAEWGVATAVFETFCLHERFSAQAALRPEAIAVSLGDSVLTYGALERQANALASRLESLGVLPGDLIGLCFERSLEMVVAVVGTLKASAAYVPLDPQYPQERLAFLLEDSGVQILLTQTSLLGALPSQGAQVVTLDDGRRKGLGQGGAGASAPRSSASELPAYVIYTSGSTGQPKGMVVTHANASRLFVATSPWFGFGPEDVWTLFHSMAFDFSVWELWGPLLSGGRLVVVPYWLSRSPAGFFDLLAEERVTVLSQTPSAFRQLIWVDAAADPAALALREVVFGGEALDLGSLAPWFARHGDRHPRLVNMYGITETTVHVTYRPLLAGDVARGSVVGQAIPDLSVIVMDLQNGLEPAPIGAPGEIFVGGAGLALGYLGRPELTAARFVPDPFSDRGGERLYRSGDRARRLADGDLEYLGRIDHQVKIRGFRIELGEIEAAILGLPGVRECVVLARAEANGETRLVAYAVGDAVPSLAELRADLAARLPEYMVPSALVELAQLPLTAHGKLDRRALPAPEWTRPESAESVAPRTALERYLADRWREVLGIERVGAEGDFFELGGNSISGAVLINRLQQELGEIVQVVVIFDRSRLSDLARYLEAEHPAGVARLVGAVGETQERSSSSRVDEAKVALLKSLVRPLAPASGGESVKNPPVLFVLSPPRSGTTLLRVMLGGHPRLFAPPELELLSYRTMSERREAFSGRDSFWLEGVLRAVMELRGCEVETAREFVESCERAGMTTLAFYGVLASELGDRMLVDKTPSYALDPAILRRGEEEFAGARYLHLVRHPGGMVRSFEEAKLDQVFFRREHPFERRELAELIWDVSQENILELLADVPRERQHRVVFEDLVRDPEGVLRGVCAWMGLEYAPSMAAPYEEVSSRRMTDGPHAASRMLGDVKFLGHGGVKAEVAEGWREDLAEGDLGAPTWDLAERLGYSRRVESRERWEAIPAGLSVVEGEAPLSFAQERLWFLDQLTPGSAVYNVPLALRLKGHLDVAAMRVALTGVVARHAVLRTTFGAVDSRAVQRIGGIEPFPLHCADLRLLPVREREGEARRLATAEARRPFDLARGPVARGLVVRLAAEEQAAVLTLHHIVSDGWSLGILVQELVALYGAALAREAAELAPLAVQYTDYAAWQRTWLAGERLERELGYWTDRLAGASRLALPTDRPRPPVQTFRGASRGVRLAPDLAKRLEEECRREGATAFMGLAAGFQALLHRWSGQDDVLVGTPIAGRTRAEVEDLIGLFVNTLVLRTGFDDGPSYRELLGRVRAGAVAAYAHQEVPFEKVVEALAPSRDLSRSPIFEVMFAVQNAPVVAFELPGLQLAPWSLGEPLSKFDLTLTLSPETLAGGFEYNRDLFDAATISRLGLQLERLLGGLLAHPEVPVDELDLWSAAERHQVEVEWNARPWSYAGEICLHEGFERQVDRDPARTAVVPGLAGEDPWSYEELEAWSNRVAHSLRRHGMTAGDRAGLCGERSPRLLASLLGILKAGCSYVPLDAEYPPERLAFLVADSGVRMVIGQEAFRERIALPERVRWLSLEEEWEGIGRESALRPLWSLGPGSAAYAIYTSGSTGVPKGVVVPHRAIANRVLWMQEAYPLTVEDRVLQKTPWSFDASIWELFLPLSVGAELVLAEPGGHRDSGYLVRAVTEYQITVLQLVPSMLQTFLEEPSASSCTSLRYLFAGGEALSGAVAQRLASRLPAVELVNLYGPTEAAIDVASKPRVGSETRAVVPLGRPISCVHLAVMDRIGRAVPIGVAGELWIGGVNLAFGYQGRADLTAERFVAAPWSSGGERAYRTGDLARWLPGGELEYLGRIDTQVKVRGVRIELGEIEAALSAHPGVAQTAVAVRGADSGRRLVGYWVGRQDLRVTAEELRAHVARRLPEAMVPGVLMELEALPVLPNGKVDRSALPEPEAIAGGGEAPRTAVEEVLAAIWSEVLGLEQVGVESSFFDLGGHSLLATRVVSRIRQALGVDLPVRSVFERPTIAGLASEIGRRRDAGSKTPPLLPVERRGALPASFAQSRLWFLHQLEPESVAYHLPLALRLEGDLNVGALAGALLEIVRRHEVLRTRYPEHPERDGEPMQEVLPAGWVKLPLVDFGQLPMVARDAESRRVAGAEAARPFDLERGPLFRSALLRLGVNDHLGLLTQHHIVSDAWSRGILIRELSALYGAALAGRPSPLVELPVQYADYAVWQRSWLTGEVLEAQLGFWRERLAGVPQALDLPTDRPRPPVQSFRGASRPVTIAAATANGLKALARRESASPFMAFLAGFQALLCRAAARSEVLVGSPIANRERLEVEGLIGFFTNTLVLRGGIESGEGGTGLRDLVGRARETVLGTSVHQDLPFEKLVEELKPERDASRTPLFQVLFTLVPAPESIALSGLEVRPFGAAGTTAKFDLSLALTDAPNGVTGAFEYATALFDPATVERFGRHFGVLLAAAVADPEADLRMLPLLAPAERHQVALAWNDTGRSLETARTIHEAIEAQVDRTPDAIALRFEGEQLSYAELDRRSNRLAHHLLRRGVSRERLVGVALERSLDLLVAQIATWKAGGGYVPIDPSYPAERLAAMLADARVSALITRSTLVDRLPVKPPDDRKPEAPIVWLDRDAAAISAEREVRPRLEVLPEQLAYAIFTSGSTGRPKGAMNEHRAVLNRLLWGETTFGFDARDRFIQKTPFSFDVSVFELFGPLLCGARLALAVPGGHQDTSYLARLLAEEGATTVHFVPSMLRTFLDEAEPSTLRSLRRVMASGEALPAALSDRFFARLCPGGAKSASDAIATIELHNLYGPTEAAVEVTHQPCRPGARAMSIGRPVANTRIHLLDREMAPVPIGHAGQLAIGGGQVGRGYLDRPELTAERFVPDPFGGPGSRLYLSGDLARHRAEGSIEFLGRTDQQVKVRGFRIELEEIESALTEHPKIQQAAVVASGDDEQRRLVAYVAFVGEQVPLAKMREHLRRRLPEYMIPSLFLELKSLPLTASGKVDRRALPAPSRLQQQLEKTYVAPRNAVEEVLAGIWADVLGIGRVGIEDDFFDLGGHSLLATRAVSRVRKIFRVDLPLRSFFGGTTVARLGQVLLDHEAQPGRTEKVARLFRNVESMSEERMRELLAKKRSDPEPGEK